MGKRVFEVITHYCKDDHEFFGDYSSMNIVEGEVEVVSYSDDYHDKSSDRVIGFFHALDYLGIDYERVDIEVADADY